MGGNLYMKNDIIIYLCDDDTNFINILQQKLKSFFIAHQRVCEVISFSDATTLLAQFNKRTADVVFLDIDMPIMTGFEAAKRLQEVKSNTHIIFVTSHEDKVFQSYEFQPFWFVRKSHLVDLDSALPKLLAKIDVSNEQKQSLISLIAENKIIEIDINKIKYISSYDHYILIKDSEGKEKQFRCKISDAEAQLSHVYFIRVQNSIIVNCRFISKVNSRAVILHDGEKINISRDKVDFVKNEFQRFIRSRY